MAIKFKNSQLWLSDISFGSFMRRLRGIHLFFYRGKLIIELQDGFLGAVCTMLFNFFSLEN
jgi:hypothetical protein